MSRFIVFEGIDGSGKDTQAKMLASYLTTTGEKAVYLTINDVHGLNDYIDLKYAISEHNPTTHRLTLPTMFLAAYMEFSTKVKEHLDKGISVIVPRWDLSMYAYTDLSLDMEYNKLTKGFSMLTKALQQPDHYIYLNINTDEAMERISARGLPLDIYEASYDKVDKIANSYDRVRKHFKNDKNIIVIPAYYSPIVTHELVIKTLNI